MKNYLLVLVAGVMLSVPLGCDREVVEDPVSYDRVVDGPPVAIKTPTPDYDVIGKPGVVKRRREALLASSSSDASSGGDTSTGGGQDPAGPSTPASDDELTKIKSIVQSILATKDSGDNAAAMAFFDEETSTAMQGLKQASDALQAKALALDLLMEEKFGAQYPAKVKENLKKMPAEVAGSSVPVAMLGGISVDQLIFAKIGEKVVAAGPQDLKLIFSKKADGWKLGLGKGKREMIGLLGKKAQALVKVLDAVRAGIDDGSITADNVDAKGEELDNKLVKPIAEKIMKAMGGAAPADGGAAPAATQPAATQPADDSL